MGTTEDAITTSLKLAYKAMFSSDVEAAPPGVLLRRARAEDYGDVMAISELMYDGMDILPELYHEYIRDPDCNMFVAVKDNRLVSFFMLQVFDNGRATLGRAARTLPEYEGHNIYKALKGYSFMTTWKKIGVVKHRGESTKPEFLTAYVNKIPSARIVETLGISTVANHASIEDVSRATSPEFTRQMEARFPLVNQLIPVTRERLITILNDQESVKRLFPSGVMSYGFKCHEASVINLKAILDPRCNIFIDKNADIIVIAYNFNCPTGSALDIRMYGSTHADDVMGAIMASLPLISKYHKGGKVSVFISVRNLRVFESLNNVLKLLPFERGNDLYWGEFGRIAEFDPVDMKHRL